MASAHAENAPGAGGSGGGGGSGYTAYDDAKAALINWERSFEQAAGRPAEEADRRRSPRYQERLVRFKEHRRRKAKLDESRAAAADAAAGPGKNHRLSATGEARRDMAREYKKLKRRLKDWEAEFEAVHGRLPTEADRSATPAIDDLHKRCQRVMAQLVVTIKDDVKDDGGGGAGSGVGGAAGGGGGAGAHSRSRGGAAVSAALPARRRRRRCRRRRLVVVVAAVVAAVGGGDVGDRDALQRL